MSSRLAGLIRRLRSFHGPPAPPPMRDPYRLLLWEQVGYMAPDPERLAAYRMLEDRVGTAPMAIHCSAPGTARGRPPGWLDRGGSAGGAYSPRGRTGS